MLFCCSYNHPHILAGQGTAALEIIEQMESMSKEIDAVIVPVGGAGFIAGISVVIKHLLPEVQVIVSQKYFNEYDCFIGYFTYMCCMCN